MRGVQRRRRASELALEKERKRVVLRLAFARWLTRLPCERRKKLCMKKRKNGGMLHHRSFIIGYGHTKESV
jgi:hypothetical protein